MPIENLHLANRSSNLSWARYDSERLILEVDFKNAAGAVVSTYEYGNFGSEDWKAFCEASSNGKSAGEYFAAKIRNAKDEHGTPRFPYKKIPTGGTSK